MDFSKYNGASSVLFLKIIRCENETGECFGERLSLYNKAADNHNMSVWQSLSWDRKIIESPGKLRECMDKYERDDNHFNNQLSVFNPYVDSGFDIFQPSCGSKSHFYKPHTTHLLKLGISGAMYTLNPEEDYFKVINWDLTNTRRNLEDSNADSKLVPYGGVYSQILFGNSFHLMNSICHDINKGFRQVGSGGGSGGGKPKSNKEPIITNGTRSNAIPQPYCLHPRSSIYKKAIRLANSTGIIDSGYRGELAAAVDVLAVSLNSGSEREIPTHILDSNKRYFQICKPDLSPFYVCIIDNLPSTSRGSGGFGSTGM